jgi:hypothetical protein
MIVARRVARAVRAFVGGLLTVILGLGVFCVGSGLFMGAVALATVAVYFLAFGLIYIVTGDAGLEQVRYFLEAYRTKR